MAEQWRLMLRVLRYGVFKTYINYFKEKSSTIFESTSHTIVVLLVSRHRAIPVKETLITSLKNTSIKTNEDL